MKNVFVIGAILLFAVSIGADAAQPGLAAFIDGLKEGTPPQFPALGTDCTTSPDLAPAFAAFVKSHPQQVSAVLGDMKRGFEAGDCGQTFGKFAAEVQRIRTGSPYSLLDGLAAVSAPPPAPPVKLSPADEKALTQAAGTAANLEPLFEQSRRRFLIVSAILAALGLIVIGVVVFQLIVQKRTRADWAERLDATTKNLNGVFMTMKAAVEDQKTQNERAETVRDGMAAWIDKLPPRLLSADDLQSVAASIDGVRSELSLIGRRIEVKPTAVTTANATPDQLTLERETLRASWQHFQNRPDLIGAYECASRDEVWQRIHDAVLFELPKHVPEDLKATFDSVVSPARDYHNLVSKITLVQRVVNDDPQLQKLEPAAKVQRSRELASLLDDLKNSNRSAERLKFRVKTWITDTFLGFADLFLQRYQQAQLDTPSESLRKGAAIVRDVLYAASVEPIDVTLGKTTFDSTRHVGRSTANDPRFGDGVIVGVIRNGFVEGGQLVMRQPEVIVNRTH